MSVHLATRRKTEKVPLDIFWMHGEGANFFICLNKSFIIKQAMFVNDYKLSQNNSEERLELNILIV